MLWTSYILCIRKSTSVHCLINYEHRERITILKTENSKVAHTNFWRNQVNSSIQEVSYFILIICKNYIQWLDKDIKSQEKSLMPTRYLWPQCWFFYEGFVLQGVVINRKLKINNNLQLTPNYYFSLRYIGYLITCHL